MSAITSNTLMPERADIELSPMNSLAKHAEGTFGTRSAEETLGRVVKHISTNVFRLCDTPISVDRNEVVYIDTHSDKAGSIIDADNDDIILESLTIAQKSLINKIFLPSKINTSTPYERDALHKSFRSFLDISFGAEGYCKVQDEIGTVLHRNWVRDKPILDENLQQVLAARFLRIASFLTNKIIEPAARRQERNFTEYFESGSNAVKSITRR